jgi:hypothetical protein
MPCCNGLSEKCYILSQPQIFQGLAQTLKHSKWWRQINFMCLACLPLESRGVWGESGVNRRLERSSHWNNVNSGKLQ